MLTLRQVDEILRLANEYARSGNALEDMSATTDYLRARLIEFEKLGSSPRRAQVWTDIEAAATDLLASLYRLDEP